jgi:hypothetical protein
MTRRVTMPYRGDSIQYAPWVNIPFPPEVSDEVPWPAPSSSYTEPHRDKAFSERGKDDVVYGLQRWSFPLKESFRSIDFAKDDSFFFQQLEKGEAVDTGALKQALYAYKHSSPRMKYLMGAFVHTLQTEDIQSLDPKVFEIRMRGLEQLDSVLEEDRGKLALPYIYGGKALSHVGSWVGTVNSLAGTFLSSEGEAMEHIGAVIGRGDIPDLLPPSHRENKPYVSLDDYALAFTVVRKNPELEGILYDIILDENLKMSPAICPSPPKDIGENQILPSQREKGISRKEARRMLKEELASVREAQRKSLKRREEIDALLRDRAHLIKDPGKRAQLLQMIEVNPKEAALSLLQLEEDPLKEKKTQRELDEEFQEISEIARGSIALLHVAFQKTDPKFANQIQVLGNAALQIASLAHKAEKLASLGKLTGLSTAALTFNVVEVGLSLASLFIDTGPGMDEVLLKTMQEGFRSIQKQIQSFHQAMHKRFDAIDSRLNTIFVEMMKHFRMMLGLQQSNLRTSRKALKKMYALETQFQQISWHLVQMMKDNFLQDYIGYRENCHQNVLEDYHECFKALSTMGSRHVMNATLVGAESHQSESVKRSQEQAKLFTADSNMWPFGSNTAYFLDKAHDNE